MELRLHIFLTSALEGVANFTSWPLYSQYALNGRLDGPHSQSGRFRKATWAENRAPNLPVCKPPHYTGCATSVSISLYGHFLTLSPSPVSFVSFFCLFNIIYSFYYTPCSAVCLYSALKSQRCYCDLSRSTCHSARCHF